MEGAPLPPAPGPAVNSEELSSPGLTFTTSSGSSCSRGGGEKLSATSKSSRTWRNKFAPPKALDVLPKIHLQRCIQSPGPWAEPTSTRSRSSETNAIQTERIMREQIKTDYEKHRAEQAKRREEIATEKEQIELDRQRERRRLESLELTLQELKLRKQLDRLKSAANHPLPDGDQLSADPSNGVATTAAESSHLSTIFYAFCHRVEYTILNNSCCAKIPLVKKLLCVFPRICLAAVVKLKRQVSVTLKHIISSFVQ